MTADQIIEVLQAWKETKPLQYRYHEDPEWSNYTQPFEPLDFRFYVWRVKPEQRKPREWWIVPDKSRSPFAFQDKDKAVGYQLRNSADGCETCVHVQEVMDVDGKLGCISKEQVQPLVDALNGIRANLTQWQQITVATKDALEWLDRGTVHANTLGL